MEIETAYGPARVVIEGLGSPGTAAPDAVAPDAVAPGAGGPGGGRPAFLLALTHGAGGDTDAPDLLAVRDTAIRLGGVVARITQPYRVSGARAPGSAARQDAAWVEIIAALTGGTLTGGTGLDCPLVQGGRSNGARVACRTAEAVGARAVIALAFPLHPPGHPDRSRAAELRVPGRKVLVVNGDRDPFGVPGRITGVRVVVLVGETHALSRKPAAVGDAVAAWLPRTLGLGRAGTGRR